MHAVLNEVANAAAYHSLIVGELPAMQFQVFVLLLHLFALHHPCPLYHHALLYSKTTDFAVDAMYVCPVDAYVLLIHFEHCACGNATYLSP